MPDAATNKQTVQDAFAAWAEGDGNAFFRLLADDVRWTVIGTTEISGSFTSRQEFLDKAAGKIGPAAAAADGGPDDARRGSGIDHGAVLARPLVPTLVSLLADGDLVSIQWEAESQTKLGLPYRQTYSWVVRFKQRRIVEGTAYLDTELLTAVLAG